MEVAPVDRPDAWTPPPARKRSARQGAVPSRRILGTRVDATSYEHAIETVLDHARTGGGVTCATSVHGVMQGRDEAEFQRVLNRAELVTPDGMPLVWMLRALGIASARRVYGPELTLRLCAAAAEQGYAIGFYGGTPAVLEDLSRSLRERVPTLRIGFTHSPSFGPVSADEDALVTDAIRASGVRLLFVGLGCPKQERWMDAHREALTCAQIGVGAAFDFLAGHKAQAPAWLQGLGLEWLFRLVCEPRRLFARYARNNPRFAGLAFAQWMRDKGLR